VTELEKTKYAEIGSRIRAARTEQKLSQSELAEKAGISSTHISEIETGKSGVQVYTLIRIAEALQVTTDSLIRPNIPEVNALYQGEFADLLKDCTPSEIEAIVKMAKELKKTMHTYKDSCSE
jgi:transcriptional regulator with XRE-family HTH domain